MLTPNVTGVFPFGLKLHKWALGCLVPMTFICFYFFLQENVSCLNTSLVILMLARRKDKLPFYLRKLQEMEYMEKYPGFILNNFHSLLRFWQQHYLNKDKDSTCLENVCQQFHLLQHFICLAYFYSCFSLQQCPKVVCKND